MKNRISLFICVGILSLVASSTASSLNQLIIQLNEVVDLRKSQVYLEKELDLYGKQKSDYYTLFLAVKNYADRLYALEVSTFNRMSNQIQSTVGNSYIGKILLGSSSNKQLYSFAKETSVDSSKQIMYFKNWRIDLNKIFEIQDDPAKAITYVRGRYLR